jgi:hypothetical protein
MNLIFEKSFSSLETSNGQKKKSFQIIKSENGLFKKISGLSNDGKSYIINENIRSKIPNKGIINKHRTFKINSSEVSSLLKDHFLIQKALNSSNLSKNILSKPKKSSLSNIKKTTSLNSKKPTSSKLKKSTSSKSKKSTLSKSKKSSSSKTKKNILQKNEKISKKSISKRPKKTELKKNTHKSIINNNK